MTTRQSNVTAAFIDLATFELLESTLYGGDTAITYFVREVQKCTWFSQIPVKLSMAGTPGWGSEFSYTVSRAADYLLGCWLRVQLPSLTAGTGTAGTFPAGVSWTPNVGHNLIKEVKVLFNDLEVQSMDSYTLDWWAAFMYPSGKKDGYNEMIGNVSTLVEPSTAAAAAQLKASYTLNIPLPFFFTRDSGVALPTAALPYNDIKIQVTTRALHELLCGWDVAGLDASGVSAAMVGSGAAQIQPSSTTLSNTDFECWCNYVVVSNDERSKMGAGPRDMVVEQTQKVDDSAVTVSAATPRDIEKLFSFNHTVKALFWSLENNDHAETHNYRSSYSMTDPDVATGFVLNGSNMVDQVTLKYDNTERFTLNEDFFSLVQPFYFANQVPSGNTGASPVGYHMYSYALNPMSSDPSGSTNFGKLTNVALKIRTSSHATDDVKVKLLIRALNFNIVRISGGALGFPVL